MPTQIAIALVRQAGRIVVGQRPLHVPLAGYWEFPGGKVEPGETPAEAAVRECREEAGLNVRALGEYARVEHAYAHGTVDLHFYECVPISSHDQLSPPYQWADLAAIALLRFPAANESVVQRLLSDAALR